MSSGMRSGGRNTATACPGSKAIPDVFSVMGRNAADSLKAARKVNPVRPVRGELLIIVEFP